MIFQLVALFMGLGNCYSLSTKQMMMAFDITMDQFTNTLHSEGYAQVLTSNEGVVSFLLNEFYFENLFNQAQSSE